MTDVTFNLKVIFGAILSEPHTSRKDGTSIVFTKICMEI